MPKYPTFPDCFDEVKTITIASLRRLGYLKPGVMVRNGPLRWTRGGQPSGSITIDVDAVNEFIELRYTVKGRFDSTAKSIEYRVRLESRTSNLGKGRVWYFICPATGRRCRTLYGIGEYFLSRSAYPSAMYSRQTESKRWRGFRTVLDALDGGNAFDRKYSRTHYKGKPTRRYRQWLAKIERREMTVANRGLLDKFLRS